MMFRSKQFNVAQLCVYESQFRWKVAQMEPIIDYNGPISIAKIFEFMYLI